MAEPWPWGQIITTVLGSGVVAALANNGITWFRASQERRTAARLTARQAAENLERYAREAAAVAQSWHTVEPYQDGPSALPWPALPAIREFDWSAFPTRLSDRAISFDAETAAGVASVADAFEYDDDMAIGRAIEVSLEAGLRAWDLAADLRRQARFPPGRSRMNDYYDFVEWMSGTMAARKEIDRVNRANHAEMVERAGTTNLL